MPGIDHEYTQGEIVCPHCGNKQDDTDFRIDGHMEGEEICEECGKEFKFESDISIYWITSKIATDNQPCSGHEKQCSGLRSLCGLRSLYG